MNQPVRLTAARPKPSDRAPEASRHFSYLGVRSPGVAVAAGLAFLLCMASLLSTQVVGQPSIVFFLGLTALFAVLFPYAVVHANARNGLIWIYPGWCALSLAWSTVPDRTLHMTLLLLPTVLIGVALGVLPERRAVNAGAALAFLLFIAYSVGFGGSSMFSDTGSGGIALTGLGDRKNYFGHLAAMSTIMAASFFAIGEGRQRTLAVTIGVLDLAISGVALVGSHATGSMISVIVAYMVIITAFLFRRVSWRMRVLMVAIVLGALILYVAFGKELQDQIFTAVLEKFNKDKTLTGRTLLWDFADRLMQDHRWLGYGYRAFWFYTNPDAWTIWRTMGIQPMSGFNFHNTPREIMIECGLGGLIIYAATYGYALVRAGLRALLDGELTSAIRLAFIVYFVMRLPVESTGIESTTVDGLLLLAFLSAPDRGARSRRAESSIIDPNLGLAYGHA